jgi:hypothetical protein
MNDDPNTETIVQATFAISSGSGSYSLQGRAANYFAPAAALTYPLTPSSFHAAVSALQSGDPPLAAVVAASVSLALSFGLTGLILVAAMSLAGIEKPSSLQLRARQVAFLSVAAPTIFVFMGVLLFMAGNPLSGRDDLVCDLGSGYLVRRLRRPVSWQRN